MIRSAPLDLYFCSRSRRIDFSMIGFMSVRTIKSWSVKYLPATKSAASTFSWASTSFVSNWVSISKAVASEMVGGWELGVGSIILRSSFFSKDDPVGPALAELEFSSSIVY